MAKKNCSTYGLAGVYERVALNESWVISAADGSVAALVRIRIPIRSPAATAKGAPILALVAVLKVPAVTTLFGNPNLTELVSGVVT